MDITSFLNPKMYKKVSLLPPEALQYLLKQIDVMPDDLPEKQKMLRIAEIAKQTLRELEENDETPKITEYNIKRFFYLPFNKIIFEGDLDQRQVGRIARNSMDKIWEYIETKLMPNELAELETAFNAAIHAKEMKKAKIIINEFNRLAGQKLGAVIAGCRNNDREWSRFAMVIGNKMVARDAEDLSHYLQNVDEIEKAIKMYSQEIAELNGNILINITNQVVKVKEEKPKLFSIHVALLIDSLKHPAHILRVIQKYYRIDDASSAAKCDLSLLGEMLLFNAQIGANNFISSKTNKNTRAQHLEYYRIYADIILGLEREFVVSPISSWGKEIIELREKVSTSIQRDILACPKLLKDILGRYQLVVDGVSTSDPSKKEIDELVGCVHLLHGIKNYMAATACNAIYRDSFAKCLQSIDVYSVGIVEQMRRDQTSNKKALFTYLEISTDLIKIIKGAERADLYRKGGMLAIRDVETVQE